MSEIPDNRDAEGVEIEVYGYANPLVKVGSFRGAIHPQVLEELEGVGGGSITLAVRDPQVVANPTWLRSRNIIKHRVDGQVVGAWLIGNRDAQTLDASASDENYTVAGEGLKSWFDDARVEPKGGIKSTSRDTRAFSFASEEGAWYIPANWINPTRQQKVLSKAWTYGPDKWPKGATGAWWVWGTSSSWPSSTAGTNYFRVRLPVTTAREYVLYLAADDNYSVYIDGEEIASYDEALDGWKEAKKVSLGTLAVGTHTVGIRATNTRGAAGLVAVIYSVAPRVAPVSVGTVTIPIGTTPTLTINAHGLTVGTKIYFTTTGTLPGGLEPNKDYYVNQVVSVNSIKISKSKGGPSVNTSGSQSGTHTLLRSEVAEVEKLVTFSGMDPTVLNTELTAANATVTTRQNTYNSLPAGSTTGTTAQKKQAKAKAKALALLNTAKQARDAISAQLTAANAAQSAGITWKVLPYPAKAPGWSPGEILLTLLTEAASRNVRMASLLTPNFTATLDSNGQPWDEPVDWSFNVGESLASVASKLEEVSCDIWINPDTYALNVVNKRGVDRSVYKYDVDGITVLESPVIFWPGKNLRRSQIQSKGKIKNSLALKTNMGWSSTPELNSASVTEYGALESVLDTGASPSISKALASIIFVQRAKEEEGASYDVYLPPTGKIPYNDFGVGDWVLAPDERGILVKRRIMSISIESGESGRPMYTMEFDTIFRDNEDRINRVIQKLGGGGVGSSSPNAGGVGTTSPSAPIQLPPPDFVPNQTIPLPPTDLEIFSIGYWSSNGVKAYGQVNLSWAPVVENTDGSEMIPLKYEVWGRPADATEDAIMLLASVASPMADMDGFEPGTTWTFFVLAWSDDRSSARSDEITHLIAGPNEAMIAPATPTATSYNGLLVLNYTGLMVNGQPPPPQFRYIYAEYRVTTPSVGPWVRAGNMLSREGRQITITSIPMGTAIEARLTAVDGAGVLSAVSGSATTTIKGVDLGNLGQEVTDAITAAASAAKAAREQLNMLNDPSFELNTNEFWWYGTGVTNVTTGPRTLARHLNIAAGSAREAVKYQRAIPCDEGDTFYFRVYIDPQGTPEADDKIIIGVKSGATEALNVSENVIPSGDMAGVGYVKVSGSWTVPAGIKFFLPFIYVGTSAIAYRVDDFRLLKMTGEVDVVAGSITGDAIAAESIVGRHIQADTIAAVHIQAEAVTAEKLSAESVTAEKIAADSINSNHMTAGSVKTAHISSEVGQELNIENNTSIQFVVGEVTNVQGDLNATNDNIEVMQTYYQFGPDGAVISKPGSVFATRIDNDSIDMLENGNVISYWNSGTLYVNQMVGEKVTLGNHQLAKFEDGTVIRALGA